MYYVVMAVEVRSSALVRAPSARNVTGRVTATAELRTQRTRHAAAHLGEHHGCAARRLGILCARRIQRVLELLRRRWAAALPSESIVWAARVPC